MKPEGTARSKSDIWALAAAFGLLLLYFDFIRAYRWGYLCESGATAWFGAAVGFAFYTLTIACCGAVLCAAVRRLARPRGGLPILGPFCVGLTAAGLIVLFSLCSEMRATFVGVLAFSAVLMGIGLSIVHGTTRLPVREVCQIGYIAFAAGIVALFSAGRAFFLLVEREQAATPLASFVWLVVAGCAALAIWTATRRARRRSLVRSLTAVVVIALPICAGLAARHLGGTRAAASNGGNVILIVYDALRADRCSLYDGPVAMPALETLASRGCAFERCYALSNWTVPSMRGMFRSSYTWGLSPQAEAAQWAQGKDGSAGDRDAVFLARLLADKGYVTAALSGNILLDRRSGVFDGFRFARTYHFVSEINTNVFAMTPCMEDILSHMAPPLAERRQIDTSAILTSDAIEFLRHNKDSNFFLWLHYMDPHAPYDPPEAFRTMDGPWPLFSRDAPGVDYPLNESDKRYITSLYEGEIRYADSCLRRILDEIDALGLRDTTYVCVTADHGEELWDHGRRGHHQKLYEELIRVPLVIAGPDIAPRRIGEPVSHIDLMPTLAEYLGVPRPAAWDGSSWQAALRTGHGRINRRYCFARGCGADGEHEQIEAAIDGWFKLIRGVRTGKCRLYDLASDPRERSDVGPQHPDAVDRLTAALDQWRATLGQPPDESRGEAAPAGAYDDRIDRLRTLGYID